MIFILMGKSASGKDTVFRELMARKAWLGLEEVVPYTTRPIRSGECDGVDYRFVGERELRRLREANKVVECREYHTVRGTWYYFTVDEEKLWDGGRKFLYIATPSAYQSVRDFYGKERVVPIYLEVDDFTRLSRAIDRERRQSRPSLAEVCRRFLADEEDFSETSLKALGVNERFDTGDLHVCCQNVINEIKRY